MALCTIGAQIVLLVIRICGGIIVIIMASEASIRCVHVIPHVAIETLIGNCNVCPVENVVLTVVERGWRPPILSMTLQAIRVQVVLLVVWIGGVIIIILVASEAGIGRIHVFTHVAVKALVGYRYMRPVKDIILTVIKGRG